MYETKRALSDLSILLARLSIGALLFVGGAGKVFGWFGYSLQQSVEGYAKSGFSAPLAYMSIFTEFIGGLLLVAGVLTRPVAFAVMINMFVATIVTLPAGILGPGGAQIPFLYLIIDIIILLTGPGRYSIDYFIFRQKNTRYGFRTRR